MSAKAEEDTETLIQDGPVVLRMFVPTRVPVGPISRPEKLDVGDNRPNGNHNCHEPRPTSRMW